MPKDNKQKLIELMQENQAQRELIADLRKQIEELVRQISTLQNQLQEALEGSAEQKKQMSELQSKLDELLFQIKNLKRKEYGTTTERHNPKQGPPPDSSEPEGSDSGTDSSDDSPSSGEPNTRLKNKATKEKRPRNHKKHINNQNLPEQEVKHSVKPEDLVCPHCQTETRFMKYVKTSLIERVVNSLFRFLHMQEVRSCPKCKDYIITAEKPEPPFPGSYVGPGLIAGVIVDKYNDALPNYRQSKRFRRQNATIPRSTQSDWMIASSLTVEPLYELMKREVLSSKVVQTDDSWVKVQDRRLKGKMRKGKITAYIGDKFHPLNFFDYSPDLSFDRNKEVLKDFNGFVQCDAANGFDALFADGSGKTEVGCSAHSRRKYWQCAQNDAYMVICEEVLDMYRELYDVERETRSQDPEHRLAARQTKSKPLTDKLRAKLLDLKDTLPPTNPLMKAVSYSLNHWDALIRYLDDPDLEIDNNSCERAIKTWVLVRKNILFCGSDAGAKAAAIHLSFISSCNRLGIDPCEYLTDVYSRINSMKMSELEQMLPDRWARNKESKPPP